MGWPSCISFYFSMWSGHYIRILYVGWPSCILFYFVSLCGVAITYAFSMWGGHHVRILYVGWPCRDSLCVAASLGQPDLFCLVLYYIMLVSFVLFHCIVFCIILFYYTVSLCGVAIT